MKLAFLGTGNMSRVIAGDHADAKAVVSGRDLARTALTALTVKLATEFNESGILINAVCPGWTATYPGGEAQGARPVADGAASIVWAATPPDDGPSGGFFRDGQRLPW